MQQGSKTIWLVGTPLDEAQPLSVEAVKCLSAVERVIGENRGQLDRYLRSVPKPHPFETIYLDPARDEEEKAWREALRLGLSVALLSDTGMPCLFDPGADILAAARKAGYVVRCVPSPTSWGTAAAVSGYEPPFFVAGFAPRKTEEREKAFRDLARQSGNLILLETPYRFSLLLSELPRFFDPKREVFVAWEIARPEERYWWGPVGEIEAWAKREGLKKGEFILVVKAASTHAKT